MANENLSRLVGERLSRHIERMQLRKTALDYALNLIGPQNQNLSGKEISDKIATVAESVYSWMTKDMPDLQSISDAIREFDAHNAKVGKRDNDSYAAQSPSDASKSKGVFN